MWSHPCPGAPVSYAAVGSVALSCTMHAWLLLCLVVDRNPSVASQEVAIRQWSLTLSMVHGQRDLCIVTLQHEYEFLIRLDRRC